MSPTSFRPLSLPAPSACCSFGLFFLSLRLEIHIESLMHFELSHREEPKAGAFSQATTRLGGTIMEVGKKYSSSDVERRIEKTSKHAKVKRKERKSGSCRASRKKDT
jgi:hypothetical protein